MFINHLSKLTNYTKRLNSTNLITNSLKFFNSKNSSNNNKKETPITLQRNPEDKSELIITVPPLHHTIYSFGSFETLPLYQNFSNLNKFKTFIPLPKFTAFLFVIMTGMAYGTPLFQANLFLSMYLINKIYLNMNRKIVEVIELSLCPDLHSVNVRTLLATFRLEMNETHIVQGIKYGKEEFLLIKNQTVPYHLYLSSKGKKLDVEIVKEILSGSCAKVKFNYLK